MSGQAFRKVMFLLKRFSSLKKLHLNKREEGEGQQESCCLPDSSLVHAKPELKAG